MDIISLPAILIVTMFGHVSQTTAGYYGNCISLRDSIQESQLITHAECRIVPKADKE